ncbi:uncharacterized protein LOC6648170 [Drosophila willistoni]|uniref:uncharacterized protein LOC6648170 n=1 Tax=Drosophila willistoni TaxID=7260 RepID=UPI00017D885F|nr:uncharacterized protein LOC6648170 [Drosophila willistoni]
MPHKLSEIKANICQIINNLQQLESEQTSLDSKQSSGLQQTTTNLLESLENELPQAAAQVQIRIKQRKRKRFRRLKNKREKAKSVKVTSAPCEAWTTSQDLPTANRKCNRTREELFAHRRCKDALSMLRKFQLLETLCELRGGDKAKLSQELDPMRQVWQRVLQENAEEAPKSLDSQWKEVLFGRDSELVESKGETRKKLLKKRIIWDSYISQGKWGSCIPNKWVLPPDEPSSQWAQYIC